MEEQRPWLTPIPRYEPPAYPYVPDRSYVLGRGGADAVVSKARAGAQASHARARTVAGGTSAESSVHGPSRSCSARPDLRNSAAARTAPAGVRRAVRGACPSRADPDDHRRAREFAWQMVRIVLEVIDGRRPVAQLAALADPVVVAVVRTLRAAESAPGRSLGAGVPSRLRVMMVDGRAAEFCATYTRGDQTFAMAGRLVRDRRSGWRVQVLRLL
nr:Rv3235 family protein [Nocardia cyriacigeorgica]